MYGEYPHSPFGKHGHSLVYLRAEARRRPDTYALCRPARRSAQPSPPAHPDRNDYTCHPRLVGREGFAPPPQGFSDLRSTPELPSDKSLRLKSRSSGRRSPTSIDTAVAPSSPECPAFPKTRRAAHPSTWADRMNTYGFPSMRTPTPPRAAPSAGAPSTANVLAHLNELPKEPELAGRSAGVENVPALYRTPERHCL